MPSFDPFTTQLMDQDPQFINFVKQQTARSTPESLLPPQQMMQPAAPVATPSVPKTPSPIMPSGINDHKPSDSFGPQLVSQLKGLVAPQEAQAREFGERTALGPQPGSLDYFMEPAKQQLQAAIKGWKNLPQNILQSLQAMAPKGMGAMFVQDLKEGLQKLPSQIKKFIDDRLPPKVKLSMETDGKTIKDALDYLNIQEADAQALPEDRLSPQNRNKVNAIVDRTYNPDTGKGEAPTMENLDDIITDWDYPENFEVPDGIPPFYFYTQPQNFKGYRINFAPRAYLKKGDDKGVRTSFASLDQLSNFKGEGNWYYTLWKKPDGTFQNGGIKGNGYDKVSMEKAFNDAIAAGWKPIKLVIPLNFAPNKPIITPPDGKAIPATPPLRPPYFPIKSGIPTTKANQSFTQRIKDFIVPTAQAASPEEVEEVRGDMATGSKVYNLSKAKKLSEKDRLAAITKIEQKAKALYPDNETQQAIYTALASNQQLGSKSPFQGWEERMR